jgi:sulfane dehydrogenase subunit SoxC
MSDDTPISRRAVLAGAAATAGAVLLEKLPAPPATGAVAQNPPQGATSADPSTAPGAPTSAASVRSTFETPARAPVGILTGASLTPLHMLTGSITPNDLLFERHHSGVPTIDPRRYKLLVHGLVDRSMTFTLDDLKRLPSVSRIYFLECSGNGRGAYRDPKPEMTPQQVDGMTSNGEWTGVPLRIVLQETGVKRSASWFLAEGGDAAKVSRSIPMAKALEDALIAYAFNGEPLRPSNGYPARLLLPGYEGSACIKWLRRIKLIDQPNMSKDETSKYTDPLANGTARQFSFVMDAKSIVTSPAHPARIDRGWHEISGIAWSGHGKIARVEVSTDGGRTWEVAELQEPVLSRAHTRFRHMWDWGGGPATLMSRATDDAGYVQPTRAVFEATRGKGTDYHYNYIRAWNVEQDGRVMFAV